MALHVLELDLPPVATALARKIAHRPGACWLWSNVSETCAYLASDPLRSISSLDPEPELRLDPSSGWGVPRWIGVLPYEAFRTRERFGLGRERRETPMVSLPTWWRYGAVAIVTDRVNVVGDDADCVRALAARLQDDDPAPRPLSFVLDARAEDSQIHEARIRSALGHIAAGDIYQVNLARRIDLRVSGLALDWLQRLGGLAPAPFAFALQADGLRIAGTSPELCLSLDALGQIVTRPIKGTRPRGASVNDDATIVAELDNDPKEIAELSMVIDLERNDLGRVARLGSVRVASAGAIESYGPVHHRVAAVMANLRPGVSRAMLLESFLPSGSVTGAPKISAMELIAALESARRGLYTGAYGWLGHDGSLRLAMAIRTVVADATGRGHYFAGGGIVAESHPQREVEETLWKSVQLFSISTNEADAAESYWVSSPPGGVRPENWALAHGGLPVARRRIVE
jgi:anthranilate/para-aminobenzoate synthase component I